MSGILPAEGEAVVANMLFKNTSVDRGTSLQLLLFTNTTVSNTTTAATLTEPSGGGYARKTLLDASWIITGSVASYAAQIFTATSAMTGSVYGYAIITTGTTPRILVIETDIGGPYTFGTGDTYTVTPSITIL